MYEYILYSLTRQVMFITLEPSLTKTHKWWGKLLEAFPIKFWYWQTKFGYPKDYNRVIGLHALCTDYIP